MKSGKTFVDSFSAGLDSLTKRQQGDSEAVVALLRRIKRFSCFEASDNPTIARTMTRLCRDRLTLDKSCGYPWSVVTHIDGLPLEKEKGLGQIA